jgi:NADH-quinone oxidoreductase subunit N
MAYGATRTTNLELIGAKVLSGTANLSLISLAAGLMFVGLGFKVASAPFHVWTPDVYEGAPIPITAFMSVGPKAAGFALLIRVFWWPFQPPTIRAYGCMDLSSLTMISEFVAIVRANIKRMLAYYRSPRLHLGACIEGIESAVLYTVGRTLMNLGAFKITL